MAGPTPPPCAVVIGSGGTGKSTVLAAVAAAREWAGVPTVSLRASSFSPFDVDAVTDAPDNTLVTIDDAHLLDDASLARIVATAEVRSGPAIMVALRTTGRRATTARLVELALAGEAIARLGPLDPDELGPTLARLLKAAVDTSLLDHVVELTGSNPLLVDRLIRGWQAEGLMVRGRYSGDPAHLPTLLIDTFEARYGQLDRGAQVVLAALASAGTEADVVEHLSVTDAEAFASIAEWGLAEPGREIARAVRLTAAASLPPAVLAQGHQLTAATLATLGADATRIAGHLWAARALGPDAAHAYKAAGEELLATEPDLAAEWFTRASSADPSDMAAQGARAIALANTGEETTAVADATAVLAIRANDPRALAAIAAIEAKRGRWDRSAQTIGAIAGHPQWPDAMWCWFASICYTLDGDVSRAQTLAETANGARPRSAHPSNDLAAAAASALLDSIAAGQADIETLRASLRELAALAATAAVAPEAPVSPQEVGAAVALAAGELLLARRILSDAPSTGARSQEVEDLQSWIELRLGDTTIARRGSRADDEEHPAAEAWADLAIDAAIARRSGDVAVGTRVALRLAEAVAVADIDLLSLDVACELLVIAHRWGPAHVTEELEKRLGAVLSAIGDPLLWLARVRWCQLEAAVAVRQPERVQELATEIAGYAEVVPGIRPLAVAADAWAAVVNGRQDMNQLNRAVAALRDVGMVWEASHLAGQAAIRTDNAAEAKSLLGKARSLRPTTDTNPDTTASLTPGGLSEREAEVGRLVLDGLTYKAIGATLYISPKTVEHHVAHIRRKLVGPSVPRAEFLAALRRDLS